MSELIKMNIFRKEIKVKKTNDKGREIEQKFDTYFGKLTPQCAKELNCSEDAISIRLSSNCKDKIVDSGFNFPLELTLSENDYFLTEEEYENENGIRLEKTICVIVNYESISNAVLPKKTLSEFLQK